MLYRKLRLTAALIMMVVFVGLAGYLPSAHAASALPERPANYYVLDEAGVLDASTENKIISVAGELQAKTKAHIVVVTLKDSRGQTLKDLGLEMLRSWGVGDKQLNNGLILLVVPSERKSRIEVGYGLEGPLPDGKTGRIQDEYMLPYFQKGDYNQGILNGFLVISQEAAKEYNVTLESIDKKPAPTSTNRSTPLSAWQIVLIVIGLLLLFFIDRHFLGSFLFGMLLSGFFRGGGGGGGGGGDWGGGSGGGGGSDRNW